VIERTGIGDGKIRRTVDWLAGVGIDLVVARSGGIVEVRVKGKSQQTALIVLWGYWNKPARNIEEGSRQNGAVLQDENLPSLLDDEQTTGAVRG
jgi:hypothetical protein